MVDPSRFAMVPRNDVPRSTFKVEHTRKSTFDTSFLVPVYLDEVLPGDIHKGNVSIFARMSNLLFPLMDNLEVESFFFFVPNRIIWENWTKFMGEQTDPSSSIDYVIPKVASPSGGFIVGGIADHLGLPTVGQVAPGQVIDVSALPFRAYAKIFNEWFRDQNLMNSIPCPITDGPDSIALYNLERRAKKHDYFTSALPWPLKGGVEVSLPIGGEAVVKTRATAYSGLNANGIRWLTTGMGTPTTGMLLATGSSGNFGTSGSGVMTGPALLPGNLYADLSSATGATINAQRLAVATQQFLEKDARGGTRYTELLKNHFGVTPEDARLQRPEYIGGGRSPVHTQAMPQTSAGTSSDPLGRLAGQGTINAQHRFQYHATEHGYILGLVNVRADVTYQQGLRRMWTRNTRFDFYWPTFANLGEQIIRNDEIYCTGTSPADESAFGYQERWAEYRYQPSEITGLFKSTSTGNIDEWHVAQQFSSLPTLNATFIRDATRETADRIFAAGAAARTMQILFDSVFTVSKTRAIPMYSVPGLTRF